MDSISRLTNQLSGMHALRHQLHKSLPALQDKLEGNGQQLDQAGLAGMQSPALVERTAEQSMFSEGERLQSSLERSDQDRKEETFSWMDFGLEPEKGQEIDKIV